jgi:hypothetical protein
VRLLECFSNDPSERKERLFLALAGKRGPKMADGKCIPHHQLQNSWVPGEEAAFPL